jgi:hypothetical protein
MSDQDKAYMGVERCGCVTFLTTAECPDVHELLAEVLRSGRHVEVTTVGEARPRFVECPHGKRFPEDAVEAEVQRLLAEEPERVGHYDEAKAA